MLHLFFYIIMVYTCVRRKEDIEKACQVLFKGFDGEWAFIGEPELGYVTYLESPAYPAWKWPVKITERDGKTTEMVLVFDEEQQNLFLRPKKDRALSALFHIATDKMLGRGSYKWQIGQDSKGEFVKSYYDSVFIDTKKQAVSEALAAFDELSCDDVLEVELKVTPSQKLVWALYFHDRILLVDTLRSMTDEIQIVEQDSDEMLAIPSIGEDYLFCDLKKDGFSSLSGLFAVRINEKAFRPIPLSKANLNLR